MYEEEWKKKERPVESYNKKLENFLSTTGKTVTE